MSYLTLEVEIDHGKATTREPSKLPEKASGLLTILQPEISGMSKLSPLEALDDDKAVDWMNTVREAKALAA